MDIIGTPRSGSLYDEDVPGRTLPQAPPPVSPAGADVPVAEESLAERVLRILRNRTWVIVQAAVLIPLIALALSLLQDKTYSASATLLFRDTSGASGSVDVNRQAATNQQLVSLPVVARDAARTLKTSEQAVTQSVSINPNGQSNLVEVQADAPTPARAAQVANTYALSFVKFATNVQQIDARNRLEAYDRLLKSLPADQQDPSSSSSLRSQLDQLRLQEELQSGTGQRAAELIQPASAPTNASAPNTKRNVAAALVLGLLLGFAIAALLERLDRRLKEPEELERLFGVPLLASIPRLSLRRRRPMLGLRSGGADTEAFRMLRATLRYYTVNRELRSLLVTSALPADGKSTVARGLAETMAEMGDSVVLVETDLRKDHLRSDSSLDGEQIGLSGVLLGEDLDDALTSLPLEAANGEERQLTMLPSGPNPPNPSELLESPKMTSVLDELERRFDFVILDSPALAAVGDALVLVPESSGVIIVGRLGHTTRDAAVTVRKQLALFHGRILGVVANFAAVETSGYHYGR